MNRLVGVLSVLRFITNLGGRMAGTLLLLLLSNHPLVGSQGVASQGVPGRADLLTKWALVGELGDVRLHMLLHG